MAVTTQGLSIDGKSFAEIIATSLALRPLKPESIERHTFSEGVFFLYKDHQFLLLLDLLIRILLRDRNQWMTC
jgi:hypothetical protein